MRQLSAGSLPAARPRWRIPLPRWLRATLGYAILGVLAGGLAAGGIWLWRNGTVSEAYSGAADAALEASASLGLEVREVLIEGRVETQPAALLAALDVKRGAPLLGVDLRAARARIEALPWVRTASVERRWPGQIQVSITERAPLALWQHNGRIELIDREGKTISGAPVNRFSGLPMVVGEGGDRAAPGFLELLAKRPSLGPHIQAAIWVGQRRWNLRLQEGIDVRLPEANPEEALDRLAELGDRQQLFSRDIVMIDLRLPDRLIVRLSPEAAQRERKPGKNT
jgi:cell division protein FtsQ